MKTKLLKPEYKLPFDHLLVEFIEGYQSQEHLTEYKIAIMGKENKHYRNINVYGEDALEDLDNELQEFNMIDRLAYLPPTGAYHAVYSERTDEDIL